MEALDVRSKEKLREYLMHIGLQKCGAPLLPSLMTLNSFLFWLINKREEGFEPGRLP